MKRRKDSVTLATNFDEMQLGPRHIGAKEEQIAAPVGRPRKHVPGALALHSMSALGQIEALIILLRDTLPHVPPALVIRCEAAAASLELTLEARRNHALTQGERARMLHKAGILGAPRTLVYVTILHPDGARSGKLSIDAAAASLEMSPRTLRVYLSRGDGVCTIRGKGGGPEYRLTVRREYVAPIE